MMDMAASASGRVDPGTFWDQGFSIIRGAFEPELARRWRDAALASADHKGDLLSHPTLAEVITHPVLVGVAKDILGDTPLYFGFSSASIGVRGRGYHKDNADRLNGDAPDWKGRYTLIRLGLYLQDHTEHSGGLNLRAGSHAHISLKKGRTVYADTAPGDIVVWNLRTTHSANGYMLKAPQGLHLPPRVARKLPAALMRPTSQERVALFVTYALPDAHLERYLAYLKTRAFMIDVWRDSIVPEDVKDALAARTDLIYRDVWSEIRDEPGLGQHKDHVDLPS